MSAALVHRGRDAAGLHSVVDGCSDTHLAHRRLSIIDLSRHSDQPFVKNGLALSYNGELYNYRELRSELVAAGIEYQTSSDTDVGAVLQGSVAAHLVADVPVASFLSGGLDSSLVTALATRRTAAIDAYTIVFRPEDRRLEAMPDDVIYARKVAEQHAVRLHEIM